MQIYPAIDIKDGKCVRLKQGQFDQVTIYDEDPLKVAIQWVKAGASYLHLVDLDGALTGESSNHKIIRKIAQTIPIPVQVGGGIRSIKDIDQALSSGIQRVILGTVAIQNPTFVEEAIVQFGSTHIVVGIDAKNGKVAIEGWEKISKFPTIETCLYMKKLGVDTIIYTDISKDGMMLGPNIEATQELLFKTNMNIIASGGVTKIRDLEKLQQIGVAGAIIGKSLYQNKLNLSEVIQEFQKR